MNYIHVAIKDKNTLILEEDAHKGDLIDLSSVTSFDGAAIEKAIEEGKEAVYQKKLKEMKSALEEKHQLETDSLQAKIKDEENKVDLLLKNKEREIKEGFAEEINQLKLKIEQLKGEKEALAEKKESEKKDALNQLKEEEGDKRQNLEKELYLLKSSLDEEKKNVRLELDAQYQKEINTLKKDNDSLKSEMEKEKTIFRLNQDKAIADTKLQLSELEKELKEKFHAEMEEQKKDNDILKNKLADVERLRSTSTVKVIGEDLETWCDREVTSYMQAGFQNCTWEKDNTVIKEPGETKGSKADYIFRVFADNGHTEELTSVILDMKSEGLTSENKKMNKDHFQQLAKNRQKKGCRYAVLVSELEADKSNDIPIYRVTDTAYPDMYVVRPQYMMTFLSMITSLTNKFADLLLHVKKEDIEFQEKETILKNIEGYKNTYLDKPLDAMTKDIESIAKASESIRTANDKIDSAIYHIKNSYIADINAKLDKFEKNIRREIKKIPE